MMCVFVDARRQRRRRSFPPSAACRGDDGPLRYQLVDLLHRSGGVTWLVESSGRVRMPCCRRRRPFFSAFIAAADGSGGGVGVDVQAPRPCRRSRSWRCHGNRNPACTSSAAGREFAFWTSPDQTEIKSAGPSGPFRSFSPRRNVGPGERVQPHRSHPCDWMKLPMNLLICSHSTCSARASGALHRCIAVPAPSAAPAPALCMASFDRPCPPPWHEHRLLPT